MPKAETTAVGAGRIRFSKRPELDAICQTTNRTPGKSKAADAARLASFHVKQYLYLCSCRLLDGTILFLLVWNIVVGNDFTEWTS